MGPPARCRRRPRSEGPRWRYKSWCLQNAWKTSGAARNRSLISAGDGAQSGDGGISSEGCAAAHPSGFAGHLLPARGPHAGRRDARVLRPAERLFDAHIFSLSFLTNSDSLQGQILEPMMDLSAVDVERYGVGGFG